MLRPLQREDFELLADWLAKPHVARWWRDPHDLQSVEETYGPVVDGTDRTAVLVVLRHGRPIGLIQSYLLDDEPAWREALSPAAVPSGSAGIDYLIGEEEMTGRGIGPELIEELVGHLSSRHPELRSVVAVVSQENRRSWRALEKAGFIRWWEGDVDSPDPSDDGSSYVYVRRMG